MRRLRVSEIVYRLEDREPASSLENAVELLKRTPFVFHVDQDRAGSHHIDGGILHYGEVVGRCAHELAPVEHAHLFGERAAMVEQILGDVAEDYASLFPDELQRAEGYQAIASPHVEQGLAALKRGVSEHPVAHGKKEVHGSF